MAEQKTQEEILATLIKNGYRQSGVDFLAYKLSRLIRPIENEEGRILFNETVSEILILLGENTSEFLKETADTILLMAAKPQEQENGEEEFKR